MGTLAYSIQQRMASGGGVSAREASRRKAQMARLRRKAQTWGFASVIGAAILASGWFVGQPGSVSHAQAAVERGLRQLIGGGGYVHMAVAASDNPKFRKLVKQPVHPRHTARRVLRRLPVLAPVETPPEVINLIAPLGELPFIELPVLEMGNLPPPPPPVAPLPPTLAPPPLTPPPAVPEPQTWIMMIAGLLVMAYQLRKRPRPGRLQTASWIKGASSRPAGA